MKLGRARSDDISFGRLLALLIATVAVPAVILALLWGLTTLDARYAAEQAISLGQARETLREAFSRGSLIFLIGVPSLLVAMTVGLILTGRAVHRELQRSRQKTDFVSAVSHELRTPLTSIRMFVETLREGRATDPVEVRECLELLATETERLSLFIERVLAWSRMESGRRTYYREAVPPQALFERALSAFRAQRLGSGRVVETHVEAGTPDAIADPAAMTDVLINLLSNADKHSPPGEPIALRASQRGRRVALEVEDRGSGIPAEDRHHIFERFWRGGDAVTRRSPGSGLGLAFARAIVEAHRGRISVAGGRSGVGTRFTVLLPAARS